MAGSKLEDLAEKSAQKNGSTAHYIQANQALKDDLTAYISSKFDMLHTEINNLKDEILELHKRESALLNEVKILKKAILLKVEHKEVRMKYIW